MVCRHSRILVDFELAGMTWQHEVLTKGSPFVTLLAQSRRAGSDAYFLEAKPPRSWASPEPGSRGVRRKNLIHPADVSERSALVGRRE
jgi:hypothetical protein